MRFSLRAGDATIFKKIASQSQAKNRSCSRGFREFAQIFIIIDGSLNLLSEGGGGRLST